MRIAFVSPDALTVLLCWKGLIRELRAGGADIVVMSAEEGRREQIEALGVTSVDIPLDRFLNPWGDVRYIARLARTMRQERCDAAFLCARSRTSAARFAAGSPASRSSCARPRLEARPRARRIGRPRCGGLKFLYRVAGDTKAWFTSERRRVLRRTDCAPQKVVRTRFYLDIHEYAPAGRIPRLNRLRRIWIRPGGSSSSWWPA